MALPTSPYYGLAGRYAMVPTYSPYAMYRVAAAPVYYSVVATQRSERDRFYEQLHAFRASIGQPIVRLPTLGFKELDLWTLYREVTRRNGIDAVIARKQWKEVAEALRLPSSCTDSGFRLRLHYKKYLEAFERKYFTPPNAAAAAAASGTGGGGGGGGGGRTEQPRRRKRRADSPIPILETTTTTTTMTTNGDLTAPRSSSASTLCSIGMSSSRDTISPTATVAAITTMSTLLKKSINNNSSPTKIRRQEPPTSPAHSSASGSLSTREDQQQQQQQIDVDGRSTTRIRGTSVDFTQLDESSIRRYARKHRLTLQAHSRETLASLCTAHFSRSTLDSEAKVIDEFVITMKERRQKRRRIDEQNEATPNSSGSSSRTSAAITHQVV